MEISDLIESIDIVDYISQFVDLEERFGEFWGLSPFRQENTPSFSVRRETKNFYDFSSGIGGSVITFVKYYFHCSGREAVEKLMKYAGFDGENPAKRSRMSVTSVCKKYKRPKQTKNIKKKTSLPPDYMTRYEKRPDKLDVWRSEGISEESLYKFEVFYDGFSDRLVYPIYDLGGNIVNIGGRTLDPDWKSKKLRKYSYFFGWDGCMDVVYGLYQNIQSILEQKEVIIFEGCKSVLLANSWGITNTAAILTSHCNPQQMRILAKLGCRVVFALDKEIDVRSDRNIAKLKKYVNVEYIYDANNLLDPKDAPVDKGREVFIELYGKRRKL